MRRRTIALLLSAVALPPSASRAWAQAGEVWKRFMARAVDMRNQAEAAGDQPYGAVVVRGRTIIAESPSRVISSQNIDAHAEREALRMAQERLGTLDLSGCVLVSTSRPCALCERAAFRAHVARMIYGETLFDGGPPRG